MKRLSFTWGIGVIVVLSLLLSACSTGQAPAPTVESQKPAATSAAPAQATKPAEAAKPAAEATKPAAAPAAEQKLAGPTIELSFCSPWPDTHPYSVADIRWMERMVKESNGRLKFKPFWAATVTSNTAEAATEIAKGVCDMGFVYSIQAKAGFDITKAQLQWFNGVPNVEAVEDIFWKIWEQFPELRNEYKGLKVLSAHSGTPSYLLTKSKPINSLADLKGMTIRGPVETIAPMKELGADGVMSPMSEAYQSLDKGIIGGVWAPLETYKSWSFAEVIKYQSNLNIQRGIYPSRMINLNTWNKLPPDIQKAMEDSGRWWGHETYLEGKKKDDVGAEAAKAKGVQVIQVPDAELARWNNLVATHAASTTKALDAKGLPGTKIYNEIRRLIDEANSKKN